MKRKIEPKPKRIAFVSNTSWSVYNFRLGIIQKLRELGHYVLVIAPKDQFSAKIISKGIDFQNLELDNYGTNPFGDFRTFCQLLRIYREYKPDFIFHYTIKPNIYGSLAARWRGIPCIAVTTGLGYLFSKKNQLIPFIASVLYRFAMRKCLEVWFLNDTDRDVFVRKKIISPSKAFILNSEGVNTTFFAPTDFEISPERELRFLFAGRILWEKGIGLFVETARRIKTKYKNVHFQILGFIDPANPDSVPIDLIAKWQKQRIISYLGETTNVRPFIAKADCLVLPSYYREGVSRVLLEAASMAKPIITTDNVGCREVVEDGVNGFLCLPANPEDLEKKIEHFILMSKDERFHMGWAGRKKVLEQFDEKDIIRTYLDKINHFFAAEKTTVPKSIKSLNTPGR